jgi:hypothetical protein
MRWFFKSFFDKWWVPLVCFIVTATIHVVSGFTLSWTVHWISSYVFAVAWIGLLASAIYEGLHKRWIAASITACIFLGTIPAYSYLSMALFFIEQFERDPFADDLKIPIGIQIYDPANVDFDGNRSDSIPNVIRTKTDFEIYNSFQPGLFEFDFWTPKIDSGKIYLKAFEVTQNYPLSQDRLEKASSLNVYNSSENVVEFRGKGVITIYEGDWGKSYAARFEVWFRPNNDGPEKKLIEKIYKIEGWQR